MAMGYRNGAMGYRGKSSPGGKNFPLILVCLLDQIIIFNEIKQLHIHLFLAKYLLNIKV
jgi:hypothetical protein